MDIVSFVVVGLLAILGVSALVEFYKKVIRKDEAGVWEIRIVALVVSAAVSALMCLNGLAFPIFGNNILNIVVYALVIFLIQLFLDMKLIKKILANVLDYIDIDKFVGVVLGKLGITMDKVRKVLDTLDITKEKLEKALKDAGISDATIEKIIKIVYEAD